MTDLTKLSNEELMALVNSGQQIQPTDAQTGRAMPPAQSQAYQQLAAAGGIDPQAPGGSPRMPLRQQAPGDYPDQGQYFVDTQGRVQHVPNSDAGNSFGAVNGAVRAIARGAPVVGSWLDEADAATGAALAPMVEPMLHRLPEGVQKAMHYDPRMDLAQPGQDFKDRYHSALNLQALDDQSFDNNNPAKSAALQGTGAVLGTVAALPTLAAGTAMLPAEAGLIPRMAVGGLEGATLGGVQGYGSGSGDLSDPSRMGSGLKAAAFGGGIGAAAPIALAGLGAGYKATVGRVLDKVRGDRVPVRAPTDAEVLAAAMKPTRGLDGAGGVPAPMPGASTQVAPVANDLAEVLAMRSRVPEAKVPASAEDDAYARIARAMTRQRQTPEETVAQVQALGPRGMIADSGDAMRSLARDAVNRPSGAEDIAGKALDLRQMGRFENGEWTVRPSSTRILDQAAEGLGIPNQQGAYAETKALLDARKVAADPAYAKVREAPAVDIGELRDFAGSKLFRDAYGRARSISEKEFIKTPEGDQIVPLPENFTSNQGLDWRTLDLMKQGMDDLVKEGKVQGIGSSEQGAVKNFRQHFIDKLDSLNPDYKAARDAYSGPTAMMDAMEAGQKSLSEDAGAIADKITDFGPGEQQMYRVGALQALKNKLGNADVTYDAARQAGVLKPNQLERFGQLFPDRQAFSKFVNDMAGERQMFRTRATVQGNSTTAKQLLQAQDNDEHVLETVGKGAVDLKTGNIMGLIQALGRVGGPAKMSEPTSEALASILTSMDGAALPGIATRLTKAQANQAILDALKQTTAAGAAQAGVKSAQPSQQP